MNKTAVIAKIKNLSTKNGVSVNILLTNYFYEAFLKRVSKSSFQKNLIFKGGFLLSYLVGVQNRSTIDIDFSLRGHTMEWATIETILLEVLSIGIGDEVTFEISTHEAIRPEDSYGGFSINLIGHLENIRVPFAVDIATGDPIIPGISTVSYQPMLVSEKFPLLAYPMETILSEKLHTIFSRKTLNSRSKDFYDVYILWTLKKEAIDWKAARLALDATFEYRQTPLSLLEIEETLLSLKQSEEMRLRWQAYSRKHSFAALISWDSVLDSVGQVIHILFKEKTA